MSDITIQEVGAYLIIYLVVAFAVCPCIVSGSGASDYLKDLKHGFQLQGLIAVVLLFVLMVCWAIDVVF